MKEKKEILETAIDAIKACMSFEDKVKKELGLEIYEAQPSLSAGVLFDCVADAILSESGQDILCSFIFPITTEYDEDNPFEIEVDGKIIEIRNNKELVNFLYEHDYFLK